MNSPRELRNARLSRAAIVVAAGGAFVGATQRVPDLTIESLVGKVLLVVGGLFIAAGLIAAVSAFLPRGGADQ